jgi:hypothetical protein
MPTTFTIKQVPDDLANALRERAAANRRSLQRELLLIVETAAREGATYRIAEPPAPAYSARPRQVEVKSRAKPAKPTARTSTVRRDAAQRPIASGGSAPDAFSLAAQLRGRATSRWSTDEIMALTRNA